MVCLLLAVLAATQAQPIESGDLVYAKFEKEGTTGVFVYSFRTKETERIELGESWVSDQFAISPDHKNMAYVTTVRQNGGGCQLHIYNFLKKRHQNVKEDNSSQYCGAEPVFSPDSHILAIGDHSSDKIDQVDVRTAVRTPLVPPKLFNSRSIILSHLQFDSTGQKLAIQYGHEIYSYDLNSRSAHLIDARAWGDVNSISPDFKRVVYWKTQNGRSNPREVFLKKTGDSAGKRIFTGREVYETSVDWKRGRVAVPYDLPGSFQNMVAVLDFQGRVLMRIPGGMHPAFVP
jgi:Tol biopolymer transport system component